MEESGCSTSDDNGDGERGPEKLTRAQRKRLRKKKLKEDASRRVKIIGPLLPSTGDGCGSGGGDAVLGKEPPAVRYSAADKELDVTVDQSGEEPNTCPRRHEQPHTPSQKDTPGINDRTFRIQIVINCYYRLHIYYVMPLSREILSAIYLYRREG